MDENNFVPQNPVGKNCGRGGGTRRGRAGMAVAATNVERRRGRARWCTVAGMEPAC
jgi:hypothetical protein